jgi:CubicO group peptidase (beta-lactamase class C family)
LRAPARELNALLSEHAARHGVPGAALGVLQDGALTTAVCGVADTGTGEPVAEDTRFAVGSLGKSMLATALARLASEGRLGLDDPVIAHVPELERARWATDVTIRDLLANRSGLPLLDRHEFGPFPGDDDAVLSRFAAEMSRGEPAADFWSYTNAGWCLLGRVLETATGRIWEAAMRAEVLTPLRLEQTTFAPAPIAEPRARGHRGFQPVEPWAPRWLAPAGSTLLSTVGDLLRLADAHLADETLAPLRETHAQVRIHSWLDAWCLGWARFDWPDGSVWGWDGLLAGHRAILRLDPERRSAIVLLTNGDEGRGLYRSLFPELTPMPQLELAPSAGPPGDLARFAGEYAWPDRRWTVSAAGDALLVEGDGRSLEALPLEDGVFLVDAADPDNPTVTFRDGVLYVMLWGLPRLVRR